MTPLTCSVVVCTRNRPALLRRCLASLSELDHPRYEVIVVDNTAGDQEVELAAADGGTRYVVEPREGLSRARNAGARAAEGEVVAYIDDDAMADPDWLSSHAAAFEDPHVSASTGRVFPTSLKSPASRAYAATGGEDLGEDSFRVDRSTPAWFERTNFGGVGIGVNMAFRRTLFESGWGFRESLGLGPAAAILGEEHYAFFTLVRDGHTVAYLPEAVVHHDYPATMSELRRLRARILRGGAAYMTMLLVEESEYRRDTLRYLREAARGARRNWRPVQAKERFAGKGDLLLAVAAGVPMYVQSRFTQRGSFSPRTVAVERPRPSSPS
jgi:cellulose synthase/poly-beta-1,6-N-acetylglucosamine synthase-like glycosyltransferase